MKDPRIVLKEKLIKIGVSDKNAMIIALDAGSSQVKIDNRYLKKFKYSNDKITKIIKLCNLL